MKLKVCLKEMMKYHLLINRRNLFRKYRWNRNQHKF